MNSKNDQSDLVKCDSCGVAQESGFIFDWGDCWDCVESADPDGFRDYVIINDDKNEVLR